MPISEWRKAGRQKDQAEKAGGTPAHRGSHDEGQQYNLIGNDAAVENDRRGNHGFGELIFAADAQQEQGTANDGEFPDDKMIPERFDCPICNRIQLRAATIQDDVGKQGVENVQHDNTEQHREESMTILVDITSPQLILSPAEAASPPA